jgi:hypothetical protein
MLKNGVQVYRGSAGPTLKILFRIEFSGNFSSGTANSYLLRVPIHG